jgi:hypothetical protein
MLVAMRVAVVAVVAVASWIVSAFAIYSLACWVKPPWTHTDHHPVMPLGQAFIAMVGATVITIALLAALIVRYRRRSRA